MEQEDKDFSTSQEDSVRDNTESANERLADKLTEDFALNLPGKDLPLPIRVIAFFTLIGGFSIIASLFTDIVRPQEEDAFGYVVRTGVGVAAVAISYGITEHKRWAVWLYGIITLVSLFTNPLLAFMPGIVVVYLYTQRKIFSPSLPDYALARGINAIKNLFIKNNGTEESAGEKL